MSLFPLISAPDVGSLSAGSSLPLFREVDWDFQKNIPIWRGGEPVIVTGARAVLVWAWNALHTIRFDHDIFSSDYGLDRGALMGKSFSEEVRRSEACRVVRDTLKINPYITSVSQVSSSFEDSTLRLSIKMTTIYGEVSIDECDIAL